MPRDGDIPPRPTHPPTPAGGLRVTPVPGAAPERENERDMSDTLSAPAVRPGPLRRLGADLGLILPGFPLAVFSFSLLLSLFVSSVATLVVWLGVLLLPLTLTIATMFARLSRARVRAWGGEVPEPRYRAGRPGFLGWVQTSKDPRRWLDLLLEMVLAFPVRLFTFTVAIVWIGVIANGLSYWFWGRFLPRDDVDEVVWLIDHVLPGALPAGADGFAVDAIGYLVLGLVALLTLPWVLRGLALLDAAMVIAGSGGQRPTAPARPGAPSSPSAPGGFREAAGGTPAAPGGVGARDASRRGGDAGLPVDHASQGMAARARGLTGSLGVSPLDAGAGDDPVRGWAWLTSAFSAVVLLSVAWPVLAAVHGLHPAVAMVLALGPSAALLLAVPLPRWGAALGVVSVLATVLACSNGSGAPSPWPVTLMIAFALLLLLLALRTPWRPPVLAWALASVLSLGATLFLDWGSLANGIVAASLGAAAIVLGTGIRALAAGRNELAAERGRSREHVLRRAELEERTRIAQELHDVVAHGLSVISVQAMTAEYRLEGVGEPVAQEFRGIADAARRALGEMRGLLALLRNSDDTPLAPQPGLSELDRVVEETRAAGAEIGLSVEGNLEVSPAAGLAVFRMVQEGLSNAVRHAPGAPIDVAVTLPGAGRGAGGSPAVEVHPLPDDGWILVRVSNPPAPAGSALPSAPGAGLGLKGVGDRAAALGGSAQAGPTPEGGFLLEARIPADA